MASRIGVLGKRLKDVVVGGCGDAHLRCCRWAALVAGGRCKDVCFPAQPSYCDCKSPAEGQKQVRNTEDTDCVKLHLFSDIVRQL